MASYSKKQLKFIITLQTGKFGSSDNNIITLVGFRARAVIDKAGGQMMGTLKAQIYGVSQSDMNSITTLQWKTGLTIINTVAVYAIDNGKETLVFLGNVINAWGDYQAAPDVFLMIQAQSAYIAGLQSAEPLSFKGGVDAAVAMKVIADKMGLTFENNGVSVMLNDVYLSNTLKEQALELARMANISLYIDDTILAICPKYSPRAVTIPEISAASGLVGYPSFDSLGVNFQTLFNPAITFGGKIKITTGISQAQGEWVVTSVSHVLESEKTNGAWFTRVRGNLNGLAIV